jgi:hypothetical protein
MMARFPLCAYFDGDCMGSPEPSINDLAVWVNGVMAPVTTTQISVMSFDGSGKQVVIPAWGNFPASFPTGKDVTIKVTYTAIGYFRDSYSASVEYNTILKTGAAWNGPIERADFIFHLPYEINQKNVEFYLPPGIYAVEPCKPQAKGYWRARVGQPHVRFDAIGNENQDCMSQGAIP